jgi:hypothetical protein
MMWTLDEALIVIRALQPNLKPLEWHVALGGGVLNTGASDKDLDLYILGFNGALLQDVAPVIVLLSARWGVASQITDADEYPADPRYREKVKFDVDGKRIDVFIQ